MCMGLQAHLASRASAERTGARRDSRDEPGSKALCDRGGAVPARHKDLAAIPVNRL
jgi:hypothetical protein